MERKLFGIRLDLSHQNVRSEEALRSQKPSRYPHCREYDIPQIHAKTLISQTGNQDHTGYANCESRGYHAGLLCFLACSSFFFFLINISACYIHARPAQCIYCAKPHNNPAINHHEDKTSKREKLSTSSPRPSWRKHHGAWRQRAPSSAAGKA